MQEQHGKRQPDAVESGEKTGIGGALLAEMGDPEASEVFMDRLRFVVEIKCVDGKR